jgi:hypothetical protein
MSQFKLYEISQLLRDALVAAEDKINYETGEIPDDWYEFLEAVQMERDEKCLAVAAVVREFLTEADAVKSEKQRLAKRQSVLENKAERLKQYLSMAVNIGEKLKDSRVAIGWRKSEGVVIDDITQVPDEYCRIERRAMATEIKDAIKTGKEIIGAHIETRQNIQIR